MMMKKTLIASAVVATLGATSAQAATIAETDTTKVDMYGRINLILESKSDRASDESDSKIADNGSRIGFKASNQVNDNLKAFARAEFRFEGDDRDSRNSARGVFQDLRNTYAGLEGGFGKLTVGNFDSIYYQATSSVLDVMENTGYRALNSGSGRARGDTIAFETADLGGMEFGVAAKHYANLDTNNNGETTDEAWNLQAYGQFNLIENLTLAIAFDQNNEDTDDALENDTNALGEDIFDPIIGASATYAVDNLSASLLLETSGELLHIGASAGYSYGSGDIYGLVSQWDNGTDSGMDMAVGANYKFSKSLRTYGELALGNDDVSDIRNKDNEGTSALTVGLRYDW
ncbi:porin [Marinospirillum sp.]|uniref:porin n=1 Tax=Marinospirillum sp. TaxID=2183934 RepID=UPI00287084B7|nr:porin [Marinospirillum sp.]MDR9469068.1 porin [Marinospirillum sp.]